MSDHTEAFYIYGNNRPYCTIYISPSQHLFTAKQKEGGNRVEITTQHKHQKEKKHYHLKAHSDNQTLRTSQTGVNKNGSQRTVSKMVAHKHDWKRDKRERVMKNLMQKHTYI